MVGAEVPAILAGSSLSGFSSASGEGGCGGEKDEIEAVLSGREEALGEMVVGVGREEEEVDGCGGEEDDVSELLIETSSDGRME